jgi:hypothetical protein
MKKNFELSDIVIVKSADREWDLHNEFELTAVVVNGEKQTAKLTWSRAWPKQDKLDRLIIAFDGVSFINFSFDLDTEQREDSKALSFAGYLPFEDRFSSDKFYDAH